MTLPQQQPQAQISHRDGFETTRSDDLWDSLQRSGWSDTVRVNVGHGPFQSLSWGNLRTLLSAYREKLGSCYTVAPDAAMRRAWMQASLPGEPTVRAERIEAPIQVAPHTEGVPTRVLLLGDTGDASEAQRAVSLQLRGRATNCGSYFKKHGVAAVLIESDLVYPAGAGGEYRDKFFRPYKEFLEGDPRIPIYTVPGNHDWNDGSLIGFMSAFCSVEELPEAVPAARINAVRAGIRGIPAKIWPDAKPVAAVPMTPSDVPPASPQPAPYYALDVGGVLYIGIDTGYGATIDIDQAEWLVRMVETHPEMPKLLFGGKPLIVNGRRAPCHFTGVATDSPLNVQSSEEPGRWYTSVDDVVRRPENGFVAVLGGDVHNYQRYLARITGPCARGRVLPYVVCGGGGVFIGQTSWMDKVKIDESNDAQPDHVQCREEETVFFPQRAHSRLFLQAIIARSIKNARFTLPIGLLAAGLLTLLVALVNAIVRGHIHAPHGEAGAVLVLAAIAVNTSARPITVKGAALSFGFGLAGAALVCWPDHPQGLWFLTREQTRWALPGALLLGLLCLLIGSVSRPHHILRAGLSVVGTALVAASALAVLALSVPRHWEAIVIVVTILVLSLACVAYATELFTPKVAVEGSYETPPRPVSAALAKRQRTFSIYETFTDGRLKHETTLRQGGAKHAVKMPLYRSFLEIEHARDTSGRWTFAFTAFGVTGEANSDTDAGSDVPPKVVDAFEVHWAPGAPLEFSLTPPPPAS